MCLQLSNYCWWSEVKLNCSVNLFCELLTREIFRFQNKCLPKTLPETSLEWYRHLSWTFCQLCLVLMLQAQKYSCDDTQNCFVFWHCSNTQHRFFILRSFPLFFVDRVGPESKCTKPCGLHIVVNHALCARPCIVTIESWDSEIFILGIGSAVTIVSKWLNVLVTPYIFIIEFSNFEMFKLGLQDPFCWSNVLGKISWWSVVVEIIFWWVFPWSVVGTVAWISRLKFLQVTMHIVSSWGNIERFQFVVKQTEAASGASSKTSGLRNLEVAMAALYYVQTCQVHWIPCLILRVGNVVVMQLHLPQVHMANLEGGNWA